MDEKKIILMAVGSNLVLKDKKLIFEARTPFLQIQQEILEINSNKWLEPNIKTENTAQTSYSLPEQTIWGELVINVRTHFMRNSIETSKYLELYN